MADSTLGWRFVNPKMEALYGTHALGETAELVAEKYNVTREAQDAFALESQRRWGAAHAAGRFAAELVAVELDERRQARKRGGAPARFEVDEHPRPDTTAAALAALRPAFRKERGTVTAGNSSGINDGAAALLLASESGLAKLSAPGARRWRASSPAPSPASSRATWASGRSRRRARRSSAPASAPRKLDLVELNEAFAAQSIPCMTELGLDPAIVNVNGGAIALGHPLGCSGARLHDHAGARARAGAARATAWRRCASAWARGSRPSSSGGEHEPRSAATTRSDPPAGSVLEADQVLGIAAHEIKNALGPLTMTLQLCERRAAMGDAIALEDLRFARGQVRRIAQLVNDLLDTARIDTGRLPLRLAPVDLCALVQETVETFRRGHAQRVVCDLPPPPLVHTADAERLASVLSNFLDNAAKYAPERAPIEVRMSLAGDRVRIAVTDHGPGIRPEDRERIFERYYRAPEHGRDRERAGAGPVHLPRDRRGARRRGRRRQRARPGRDVLARSQPRPDLSTLARTARSRFRTSRLLEPASAVILAFVSILPTEKALWPAIPRSPPSPATSPARSTPRA